MGELRARPLRTARSDAGFFAKLRRFFSASSGAAKTTKLAAFEFPQGVVRTLRPLVTGGPVLGEPVAPRVAKSRNAAAPGVRGGEESQVAFVSTGTLAGIQCPEKRQRSMRTRGRAMATESRIFMVLGMHRSGTSIISGILHEMGVTMGTPDSFIPAPNAQNPKGFFENHDFRKINDGLLETRGGYVVKDWNPSLTGFESSWLLDRRMKKLIKGQCEKYPAWGWKDPRQMLTCPHWWRVFSDLQLEHRLCVIFVYRDPISVARSMCRRGNIHSISHGVALWFLYNDRAVSFLDSVRCPQLYIAFNDVIHRSEIVGRQLAESVGMPIDPDFLERFVEPSLAHTEDSAATIESYRSFDPEVHGVLSDLQAKSRTTGG